MLERTQKLMEHSREEYRKGNLVLSNLGKLASKEVKELFQDVENKLKENYCLNDFEIYKEKTQWQRGHNSKITSYFAYILKHKDYKDIGSTIGLYIEYDNNKKDLCLSTSITLEYKDRNDIFDSFIQNSLVSFENNEYEFNTNKTGKNKWNSLDRSFYLNDYNNKDLLINDIVFSIKYLEELFIKILDKKIKRKSSKDTFSYIINKSPKTKEITHTPTEGNTKVDGVSEAKRNKITGDFFEQKVVEAENNKLTENNIDKVAKRVTGDSFGYDIISFDKNGNEIFIEVKGTGTINGRNATFYITANEIEAAKKYKAKWFLYRVYVLKNGTYSIEVFDAQSVIDSFTKYPSEYEVRLSD